MTVPTYLTAFVDDAAIFPPGNAPLEQAVADHVDHRDEEYADLVGGFVVSDVKVADLARRAWSSSERSERSVETTRTSTSSSPAAPARSSRPSPGSPAPRASSLRAVEFALRDEEDLAHNAQRLIQVVDSLGRAARRRDRLRRAAGAPRRPVARLAGRARRARRPRDPPEVPHRRRDGGPVPDLGRSSPACIEAALDRELPFKCTAGLHNAVRHRDEQTGFEHHGFLNVLLATRTSLDGGGPDEVAQVLEETDGAALAERVSADPDEAARTRRWFTSFGSCSVLEAHEDLVELGLL